jgi:epoxyqueuosine reductase
MRPNVAGLRAILADRGIQDSAIALGPVDGISSPGLIACALPYPLLPDPEAAADSRPFGAIASFARLHHYRVLADRLMRARDDIRTLLRASADGHPSSKSDFPIHVNSRVDEKRSAAVSGLGSIGLHSLLISPASGCACVIGLMGLPFAPEGADAVAPAPLLHPACHSCRACQRACPVQAIKESGGIDRELCLQAYMSDMRPVPDAVVKAWGRRFYGCDECLRACPRSKGALGLRLSVEEEKIGWLGDRIDLGTVIDADDAALSERFKGSALGLSWLDAATLRKNASIALRSWQADEKR